MKTSELNGYFLDWAVAKCEGIDTSWCPKSYEPITNWTQGGPIIHREKITLEWTGENWMAYIWHDKEFFAYSPLIAAMRCYVASKLGDEVEIPEELLTGE